MDDMEREFLELQGFIPENVQASRDMQAGKITVKEYWRIVNRNIDLSRFMDDAPAATRSKPRPKDIVSVQNEWGELEYGRIIWIDRGAEKINVHFFASREVVEYDYDDFYNYSSKGGRTRWILD